MAGRDVLDAVVRGESCCRTVEMGRRAPYIDGALRPGFPFERCSRCSILRSVVRGGNGWRCCVVACAIALAACDVSGSEVSFNPAPDVTAPDMQISAGPPALGGQGGCN